MLKSKKTVYMLFTAIMIFLIGCVSVSATGLLENTIKENSAKIWLFYQNDLGQEIKVEVDVPKDITDIKMFAMKELISGKHLPENVLSEFPEHTTVNSVVTNGNTIIVDLAYDFVVEVEKNNNSIPIILDSITNTLFQFNDAENISFTFDGKIVQSINQWDFEYPLSKPKESNIDIGDLPPLNVQSSTRGLPPSQYGKRVYLDPGHGGSDPGASGNGVIEKEYTLKIALACRSYLNNQGYTVYMRRTTDTYTDFTQIAGLANNTNATVFVSIHCNSATNSTAKGSEVFYPNQSRAANSFSDRLSYSQELANAINTTLGWNFTRRSDWGKSGGYNVIIDTKMFACLVEAGFVSNSGDANIIKNDYTSIGENIGVGIRNWFLANGLH